MADWTRVEVEATVADYFAMLEAELRGEPFNKTEHRKALMRLLDKRPAGAVERKHQNISAILIELGLPYIDGYKPLGNYQQLLFDVVADRVGGERTLLQAVESDVDRPVEMPTFDDILSCLVDPPRGHGRGYPRRTSEKAHHSRQGADYNQREGANRDLGNKGELFVLAYEKARLVAAKHEALAARVEHVSRTRGDGLGYDILSFDVSSRERLVEVKTTKHGKETPFFVSRNEVGVSQERSQQYHLYRVFSFTLKPRLFFKRGALDHEFMLEPETYRARSA